MATLITETQWHGNPRPVVAYASTIYNEMVPSPYYLDGRDVPTYGSIVTSVPLESLEPEATINTPGPLPAVVFTLAGVYLTDKGVDIAITRTGGAVPSYVNTIITKVPVVYDDFATQVADILSVEVDMSAVAVDGVVTVTAVAPATALTITALTVV
jgi:hypothetical protein